MNRAREHALARPALAEQENGGFAFRYFEGDLEQFLHGGRSGSEIALRLVRTEARL